MIYVFLDENQDIYRRSTNIPVPGEPMVLDCNCRNTSRSMPQHMVTVAA